jgi:hypothetical protein
VNYPLPPSLLTQAATQADTVIASPLDLTRWNYSFDYFYSIAETGAFQVTIDLSSAIRMTFTIVLSADADTGIARVDVPELQINGIAVNWNETSGTISNGSITLPAPIVAIHPSEYTPVRPPGALAHPSFIYLKKDSTPPQFFSAEDAGGYFQRTVSVPGLNVLLHQRGNASVLVSPAPEVRFPDPVHPMAVRPTFSLDNAGSSGENLENALNRFFEELFAGGDGSTSVIISMKVVYSHEIQPGLPVSMPVCAMSSHEMPVNPGATRPMVSELAAEVSRWLTQQQLTQQQLTQQQLTQQQPPRIGNARLDLRLTLSDSLNKLPLLVLEHLSSNLSDDLPAAGFSRSLPPTQ